MSDLAAAWLDRLRPELAGYAGVALENISREFPAYMSCEAGYIAHLRGLNLSRAWCWRHPWST